MIRNSYSKTDEARVRRIALRRGIRLERIRRIDKGCGDYGHYRLTEISTRTVFTAPSLLAVEAMLTLDSALIAEALEMPVPEPVLPTLETVKSEPPEPSEKPAEPVRRRPSLSARKAEARETLRALGFELVGAFRGWQYTVLVKCLRCGRMSDPVYRNLVQRRPQGCCHCAPRGRISASRATVEATALGFTPESPYAGLKAPWTLVHDACGSLVRLSLKDLRKDPSCPACDS